MRRTLAGLVLLGTATFAVASVGADESGYSTKTSYGVALPAAHTSFGTSADAFGASQGGNIDGFPLRSKILAAADSSLFLQKNFGASSFVTVGNVVGFSMDPSFVKIAPDGSRIALGTGFYKPLYVFPTSALSAVSPPDVGHVPGALTYDLSYYDGAWRDSRFFFVNTATFDGEPGSAVLAIDTEDPNPSTQVRTVIARIPGASGGVTFDRRGNLITGNGYSYQSNVSGTGQLKIWSAADVASALQPEPQPLDYVDTGHVLAEHVLSAAWLGFDSNDDLHVGGGDAFGGSGEYGYAGLVSGDVLTRVLAGGAPLDRDNPAEFTKIAPDPCQNDDATAVLFVPGVEMLSVSYNAQSQPPDCASMDVTGDGVPPHQQLYFPPGAPDTDGDGVPDGADNAYQVPNPDQTDTDGDGYGDVADCDADNDDLTGAAELSLLANAFGTTQGDAGFDAFLDLDHDGAVGLADFQLLQAKWGLAAVCELP
jgi:hypothetical protein